MENKENAKKLLGSDLLFAVFNHFPKNVSMFLNTEKDIMLLFYDTSKKEEYSSLFENYHFDEDGAEPCSKAISHALGQMHQDAVFHCNNEHTIFMFNESIEIHFGKFIEPELSVEQKVLIKELSDEIQSNMMKLTPAY